MTPPPQAQRITKESQPVFPCWLWQTQYKQWFHCGSQTVFDGWIQAHITHWHPDQPTAPTERPESAPTEAEEPTPETDANIHFVGTGIPGHNRAMVDADFARQLERQRDEARRTISAMLDALNGTGQFSNRAGFHPVSGCKVVPCLASQPSALASRQSGGFAVNRARTLIRRLGIWCGSWEVADWLRKLGEEVARPLWGYDVMAVGARESFNHSLFQEVFQ